MTDTATQKIAGLANRWDGLDDSNQVGPKQQILDIVNMHMSCFQAYTNSWCDWAKTGRIFLPTDQRWQLRSSGGPRSPRLSEGTESKPAGLCAKIAFAVVSPLLMLGYTIKRTRFDKDLDRQLAAFESELNSIETRQAHEKAYLDDLREEVNLCRGYVLERKTYDCWLSATVGLAYLCVFAFAYDRLYRRSMRARRICALSGTAVPIMSVLTFFYSVDPQSADRIKGKLGPTRKEIS